MKMRFMGKTGLKVSELCLGTMTFGGAGGRFSVVGGLGQKEADVLVNRALEAGVNFFDTADVYAYGESEQFLGKALGSRRKDVIIATKVRSVVGPGPNDSRLSRHHIIEGCNASLARLGTDYIDLYQLHGFDHNTPLEETLRALDDLVRQGKVRYIGASNFSGWQLMKALGISDHRGWERFATQQASYSLATRDLEHELVPLCLDQGVGIITYGPLAGGFLSGKYRKGQPRPSGTRLSEPNSPFAPQNETAVFEIIEELAKIARERQVTVAQVALNYLVYRPGITSLIIGARTPEQLSDNLKTVEFELTPDEVARLSKISQPPRLYPYWMQTLSPWDRPWAGTR